MSTSTTTTTGAASLPRGVELLHDPSLNKGTAFTEGERDALRLRGLLPPHVATQEQQVNRVLENFRRKSSELEKYVSLRALHDRNETLFFRLSDRISRRDDADRLHADRRARVPAVYAHLPAPTRYVRQRGGSRANCRACSRNWPRRDVAIIVVSDGERILGLGDLGRQRHGHSDRQAVALHGLRRRAAAACLPVLLDVGHRQSGAPRTIRCTSACIDGAFAGRSTMRWSTSSSRPRASSFRAS